jgi:HTH-type transcriptional repressor of NAD biosynthesis genes
MAQSHGPAQSESGMIDLIWSVLPGALRAKLCRRIVVTGAESTGTTTLALRLAEALNCPYVPEYGREYTLNRAKVETMPWRSEELIEIARTQSELEHEATLRSTNRWIVADTDAMTTALWHERYFGHRSSEVDAIASAQHKPFAYILTGDEIAFAADDIREGGIARHELQDKLRAEIHARNIPSLEVHGSVEARLNTVLAFLSRIS